MENPAAAKASPDLDDVYQEEPAVMPFPSAVPVHVEGPVMVHDLPARRTQMKTDIVPAGTWTPLLPETPKRKQVILLATDKNFYVSPDGTGVTGMLWPANIALPLTVASRIYVMSADPAGSTISHVSELWAD